VPIASCTVEALYCITNITSLERLVCQLNLVRIVGRDVLRLAICYCRSPYRKAHSVYRWLNYFRTYLRIVYLRTYVVLTYVLLIYLRITYSMETSLSWEANRFSASQEIPRVLWNPKLHCRIRKFPSPDLIQSQLDPVHTPHIPLPEDRYVPFPLLRSHNSIDPGPRLSL